MSFPEYFQRPPSKILPWLYLGDKYNATDEKLNMKYIVNAAVGEVKSEFSCKYYNIDIEDADDAPIKDHFEKVSDFLDGARKRFENDSDALTLVHCAAGMSRSVTLVLAYLIIKLDYTLKKAMELVKNARPIASPNDGFIDQLIELDTQLHGSSICEDDYYDVDPNGSGGVWIKYPRM